MRAFVTGAKGFVGTWLSDHLRACGDEVLLPPDGFDLTNAEVVRRSVLEAQPDCVYHLGARSHVGESWKDPAETFAVNATGTLNLLDAALACNTTPTVLVVSSSEVYGTADAGEMPLAENAQLRPVTPYAASKVAAEFLGLQAYLGTKLPVIVSRSFNHVGPGQRENFVVSAFAKRIVDAEAEGRDVLKVGNLEARRDFTDVRDVVRAYRILVEQGTPGEIYNVCSNSDISIGEIAEKLLALSGTEARLEVDPQLLRPVELPVLRGDNSKIMDSVGWKPEISIEQTLRDTLDYWHEQSRLTAGNSASLQAMPGRDARSL